MDFDDATPHADIAALIEASRQDLATSLAPASADDATAPIARFAAIYASDLEQLRSAAPGEVASRNAVRAAQTQERLALSLADSLTSILAAAGADTGAALAQWDGSSLSAPAMRQRVGARVSALQQGFDPAAVAAQPGALAAADAAAQAGAEAATAADHVKRGDEIATNFSFGIRT